MEDACGWCLRGACVKHLVSSVDWGWCIDSHCLHVVKFECTQSRPQLTHFLTHISFTETDVCTHTFTVFKHEHTPTCTPKLLKGQRNIRKENKPTLYLPSYPWWFTSGSEAFNYSDRGLPFQVRLDKTKYCVSHSYFFFFFFCEIIDGVGRQGKFICLTHFIHKGNVKCFTKGIKMEDEFWIN